MSRQPYLRKQLFSFALAIALLLIIISLACAHAQESASDPALTTCDDSNSCTFDWHEGAICHHEHIPPPCQPLLLHSSIESSSPWSSLNAHRKVINGWPGHAKETPMLEDEYLDIILLVSIHGDTELIKNRVWTFLENIHTLNFLYGKKGASIARPKPFWMLGIYNETDTWVVQSLTKSFDTLVSSVRTKLFPAIRRMDTFLPVVPQADDTEPSGARIMEKKSILTPVAMYRSIEETMTRMNSSVLSSSFTTQVHRPHAHQHIIMLDGLGRLTGSSFDQGLREKLIPTQEQVKENNFAMAALLHSLSSTTLSLSFSLFFSHLPHLPFFEASLGSASRMKYYAHGKGHFNAAETLAELIKDKSSSSALLPGQDSSFVAQMLSRSYMARSYDVQYLETKSDGALSHVWEPHYVHPRSIKPWCSSCHRWNCSPERGWVKRKAKKCTKEDEVCSIIHGCTTLLPPGSLLQSKLLANLTTKEAIGGITSARSIDTIHEQVKKDEAQRKIDRDRAMANGNLSVDAEEIEVEITAGAIPDANNPDAFGFTSNAAQSNLPLNLSSIHLPGHPYPLFHTHSYTDGSHRWTRDFLVQSSVEVKNWSPELEFTKTIIQAGRPVILRNTVVKQWSALKAWNAEYLLSEFQKLNSTMNKTKISTTQKFFDPDLRTPLSFPLLVNLTMTYSEEDLNPVDLFSRITHDFSRAMGMESNSSKKINRVPPVSEYVPPNEDTLNYYFGAFPESLLPDITPYSKLFDSEMDVSKRKMFLWLSSGGVNMHTHFDQDHNFFVQLVGVKRFTLIMPEEYQSMHLFPRIHPLWHKSQVDPDQPDLEMFPRFAGVKAFMAEVGPGDVLYIPPYTWHQVETVTPSVSMSIWSHDTNTVTLMESIYLHDHKIDLLANTEGRTYALRLYIDLMVQQLYGANSTTKYVHSLVFERYRSLTDIFREERDRESKEEAQPPLCPSDKIPTAQHVYGDAVLDKEMMSGRFLSLTPPSTRDLLFSEYLEELTAAVVGPTRVMRFFLQCFQGQTYRLTQVEAEEHDRLWHHV